ncbi:hypothetical protein QYF36_010352 [Acer negundo]|nr:hypothetical protein QYF36_010352 [Acer negundo]
MNNLADLELEMLDIRPNIETVAINSVLELHHLLAQLGGIEKVVSSIKSMKPMIIMVVEQRSELQRPISHITQLSTPHEVDRALAQPNNYRVVSSRVYTELCWIGLCLDRSDPIYTSTIKCAI